MIAKTRDRTLMLARDTLTIEAEALQAMRDRLEGENAETLIRAVEMLQECKGRIVVSGIGKSGCGYLCFYRITRFFCSPRRSEPWRLRHGDA